MLFEDGDMEDFVMCMDNFGVIIEQCVGDKVEVFEYKVDEFCLVLVKVDYVEICMQKYIFGLGGLDLLEINSDYSM